MKTLLLILLPFCLVAQMPLDETTHLYTYSEVVNVDSATKEQLYVSARTWFADEYKSADDVIQMDDKEAGRVIGKGNFKVHFQSADRRILHKVQIDVKDGRYKYTITDFKLYFSSAYGEMQMETLTNSKFWGLPKLLERTDSEVKQIIKSLKQAMATSATASDDW